MYDAKRILIVGAGITGTALAALLEKRGVVPTVVEKAADWDREGYGITVMPSGMNVLKKLNLATKIRRCGSELEGMHLLTAKGLVVRQIELKAAGVDCVTLRRGDLHAALRSKLKKTRVRMHTTVTNLHEIDTGVTVSFSDNSQGLYDLVIGTDGVRSAVREHLSL